MTDAGASTAEADEAWAKYPNTILDLRADSTLRVDLRKPVSAAVRRRLAEVGLETFAVMTAENPDGEEPQDAPTTRGERRREVENEQRLSALQRALQAAGIFHVPVRAISSDGQHVEVCFAMQLDARAARRWAQRFSQLAYFFYDGERFWLYPGMLDKAPQALPVTSPR